MNPIGWAVVAQHPEHPSYILTGPGSTFWPDQASVETWWALLGDEISGWTYTIVALTPILNIDHEDSLP